MSDKVYIAFGAAYASVDDAKADFAALKEIKREGEIRDLTAAICYKNDKGRIVVHETTHAGKVAAGVGIVAGAIIGALFPPAGMAVIASAVGGAAGLGVVAGEGQLLHVGEVHFGRVAGHGQQCGGGGASLGSSRRGGSHCQSRIPDGSHLHDA